MNRMTIADFEQGKRSPLRNNLVMIRQAFEQQGVTFIDENGGPPGLREPRSVEKPLSPPESQSVTVANDAAKKRSPSATTRRRAR